MFLGAHCYLTNSFLLMAGYMGYVHCNVLYPCMNILVYARLQHKTVICQLILFNGESCMLNVFKTANIFPGKTRSVTYANTARSPLLSSCQTALRVMSTHSACAKDIISCNNKHLKFADRVRVRVRVRDPAMSHP